jgi:hypothetical protein
MRRLIPLVLLLLVTGALVAAAGGLDSTEVDELRAEARARLRHRSIDETVYYVTRHGSPLACVRPLQLLAEHDFSDVRGWRIADFGYGTACHLRLLASLGADVHGIEVDPLTRRVRGCHFH